MINNRFRGAGVALVTPFEETKIDFKALSRVVKHVIEGGVDFLVVLGSTGEAALLNEEEQAEVLHHVIQSNTAGLPIVAGHFAGMDTRDICQRITDADLNGVDALLVASPAYVKPSQEGIYRHYMAIANVSPVPIIIYNVPGRTMSNISWNTTIRLANEGDKFLGIKEASGDLIQVQKILHHRPEHFIVSSGDDELALPFVSMGGDGIISVIANAFPQTFSQMILSALTGDSENARRLNRKIYPLHHHMYVEGNPVGVKAALEILGICSSDVRLPLTKMTDNSRKALAEAMK